MGVFRDASLATLSRFAATRRPPISCSGIFACGQKLESDLAKDVERRIRSMFRTQTGAPPDTTAVRLLMADFATSMLGARLTADSFLSHLCGHDVLLSPLSGHSSAGTQMQKLNRLYLREVDALLINRAEINREESTAAYSALVDSSKSVMLEGTAGGGKSCIVAQIVKQLDNHHVLTLVNPPRPPNRRRPFGPSSRHSAWTTRLSHHHLGRTCRGPAICPVHRPARRPQHSFRSSAVGLERAQRTS